MTMFYFRALAIVIPALLLTAKVLKYGRYFILNELIMEQDLIV